MTEDRIVIANTAAAAIEGAEEAFSGKEVSVTRVENAEYVIRVVTPGISNRYYKLKVSEMIG